jgi:hypothetical protein
MHRPDRYQRRGAVPLFAALLVHTGETLARCFERKRFVEFQRFLELLFGSVWGRRIRSLHLIPDTGSTHAPKRLPGWLTSLGLPFPVHLHWLPVNASWLDQVEIVFSELQRKALRPNDFASTDHVRQRILGFFAERNRRLNRSSGPTRPRSSRPKSAVSGGWPRPVKTRCELMIRCTKMTRRRSGGGGVRGPRAGRSAPWHPTSSAGCPPPTWRP